MNWLEEHPYLTGGLVLAVIVLFLVLRGRSSASASTVQAGPSDALQAASLQAQVQQQSVQAAADVQNNQTGAALAAHLADVQASLAAIAATKTIELQKITTEGNTAVYGARAGLEAVQSTNLAQADIADTASTAGVQIAGISANRDIQIAGIQAPVSLAAIQANLAAVESTNQTSLGVAGINANAAVNINAANVAGAESIANTQASVPLAATAAQVTLGTQAISAQAAAIQAQIAAQQNAVNQAYQAIPGIGGSPNRVAVISATLGQTPIGVAAEGASATSAAAGSGVWSSFWQGLFGAAPKVVQAVAP